MYRPIAKDGTPVLLFKKVSPWKDHMIFIVPTERVSLDACHDCKYYYILNLTHAHNMQIPNKQINEGHCNFMCQWMLEGAP